MYIVYYLFYPFVNAGSVSDSSDDDGDDDDDADNAVLAAPLRLQLPPKIPLLAPVFGTEPSERSIAQRVVDMFEDFVLCDGNANSPIRLYTPAARKESEFWKSSTEAGKKNRNTFSERCKAYVGIRLCSSMAEANNLSDAELKMKAQELTKDEKNSLCNSLVKSGFWFTKAVSLYDTFTAGDTVQV